MCCEPHIWHLSSKVSHYKLALDRLWTRRGSKSRKWCRIFISYIASNSKHGVPTEMNHGLYMWHLHWIGINIITIGSYRLYNTIYNHACKALGYKSMVSSYLVFHENFHTDSFIKKIFKNPENVLKMGEGG